MSLFNSHVEFEEVKGRLTGVGKRVHFIGILGAGMLPLAEYLIALGHKVTGSDRDTSRSAGREIPIAVSEHRAQNVVGCDLVVYSLAIDAENCEYEKARRLNIPTVSRAQLLGVIMSGYKHRIGVSGTHGKSTTVSMLHAVFERWGACPTVISGAELAGGGAFRQGEGEYFIYESCEYRDSFLSFLPTMQIITNAEYDHADYFKSHSQMLYSFVEAANLTRDRVFVNADDEPSMKIADRITVPIVTFGFREDADFVATPTKKGENSFSVYHGGKLISEISLSVGGRGNTYDALSTLALCYSAGVPIKVIEEALSSFRGIPRRMERVGFVKGRDVYYDYAHHPTEILNTLEVLRKKHEKIAVVFVPHTYSRTAALFSDFVRVLSLPDYLILLPTYAAREIPVAEFDSRALASAIGKGCVFQDADAAVEYLLRETDGAVALMGAGDMTELLGKLQLEKE